MTVFNDNEVRHLLGRDNKVRHLLGRDNKVRHLLGRDNEVQLYLISLVCAVKVVICGLQYKNEE
jgi:hypothetical protein